jgi:hypothetical protein
VQDRPAPRRGAGDLLESETQTETGLIARFEDFRISGFEDLRISFGFEDFRDSVRNPEILRS